MSRKRDHGGAQRSGSAVERRGKGAAAGLAGGGTGGGGLCPDEEVHVT